MNHRSGGQLSHRPFDVRIARYAAERHGVFSREDALRLGATRRIIDTRLATGRWERVHQGVYRFTGSPASWLQNLAAACLAAGSTAVASHRSAARLSRFADRSVIEITVRRGRRIRLRGVKIHEVVRLLPVDVMTINGIPATSPTRTLIDLGAVTAKDELEEYLDDALRRGLTTIARLRWRMAELGARPGTAKLRGLLDARVPAKPIPQSVLETRFVQIVRQAGLPEPECQYRIRDRGRVRAVVDFAYPRVKVAIEVDGYRWHSGRAQWERDLARRSAITSLGWRVIHVTARDIERNQERIIGVIRGALLGT